MTGRGDMPTRRVKLTYDDYVLYPEDGLRHELIDGRHYVSAAPSTRHQRISARLLTAIASWLEAHPVGEVFAAPFDVVFTRFDVVEPDLVYISLERAATQLTELHARGADLVIEIASPSTRTRDETIKRQLYEQADVSEYWFVEPESDFVRVYRREGQGFGQPVDMSPARGDVLRTPLLPGFELLLTAIFRR